MAYDNLELDKSKVSPDLIRYSDFLDDKYKLMTEEEYSKIENPEKTLEELNNEINSNRIQKLSDLTEHYNPGFKFKRLFENMRKKLRIDEKIQNELNLEYNPFLIPEKLNENLPKFSELEEADNNEKFQRIFKCSYHKILISFFSMILNLRKNKQDFSIIFRFFGHSQSDIEEFIFEFNCFTECLHPRFKGDFGYEKVCFNENEKFKIDLDTEEFCAIIYRGDSEEHEKIFFETLSHPNYNEIEAHRDNIEEFYSDANTNENNILPTISYRDIYINFMDKLHQNSSFVILDDYSYFKHNDNKHGKLFLIDPYDLDTLQIFFDNDLDKYPEKIDTIDVNTKKKLDENYTKDKFIVNVDSYKAICDPLYFIKKINECINNRKAELTKNISKEIPIIPTTKDYDFHNEIMKLPSDIYLQMTVLPLLNNALSFCEMIRPQDPISFIANFMLNNKDYSRKIDDIIKELPKREKEEINIVPDDEDFFEEEQEEKEEEEVEGYKEEEEKENKEEVKEETSKKNSKNVTKESFKKN